MITSHRRGDVAVLTLDRHERRNALDREHLDALREALREAVADGARVVVVTGAGSSFCAGADLDAVHGDGFRAALGATLGEVAAAPVPVVAAVNGPAIGAGTQLALACDLRVVAASARFAVPTARHGIAVDPWTVRRLALLAGGGPARALLLGVDELDAGRALALGLADRIGGLEDALDWAGRIASLAPASLRYAKLALDRLLEPGAPLDDPEVAAAYAACWAGPDAEEGRRARHERRPPRFGGG